MIDTKVASTPTGGPPRADRWIRGTTTASVAVLAVIAAAVSFRHIHELAVRHGEPGWTAALLPLSCDGMIAAASMAVLADSRRGVRGGILPWALLVLGITSSLTANMAVADPTVAGRIIAAWPPIALAGAFELLMRQIRAGAEENTAADSRTSAPYDERLEPTEPVPVDVRHQAWLWALGHRAPDGGLPSGRQIAAAFDRKERWGRAVKSAGQAGELGSISDGARSKDQCAA